MLRTSERFANLPHFPMAGMKEARRRLEAEGVDVIDLGAGDSGLAPPPEAIEALRRVAGDVAHSGYAFQVGLPAFREAIAEWMSTRFGVTLDPSTEILPLIGSKEGIAHLPLAVMNPGDVAIVPDPGYTPYAGGVILAGGVPHPVALRPEHDFLIPLGELRGDVAARARVLYLNYPNNPTTATAPDTYLEEAIEFCAERGTVLAYDNAYSEIAFDGHVPRSILEFDGAMDVAVEFHSLSKTYNMTGWRMGWVAGNSELIAALSKVKTFTDTGQFLGVQAAGAAALGTWESWVPGNVRTFQDRRDAAVKSLKAHGFDIEPPAATMYLWVPLPEGQESQPFALRAVREQGVIVVPGGGLGAGGEGFFRMALTSPPERMAEAAARLGSLI